MTGSFERLEPKLMEGAKIALFVIASGLAAFLWWRGEDIDARSPKLSVAALRAQYDSLPAIEGAHASGGFRAGDRGGRSYLGRSYQAPQPRIELYARYTQALVAQGWRPMLQRHARLEFCRGRARLVVELSRESSVSTDYALYLSSLNDRRNSDYCGSA